MKNDKLKNGGPAFPAIGEDEEYDPNEGGVCLTGNKFATGGMTLRDYFAGEAIALIPENLFNFENNAEWCYKVADAMIAARER